MPVAPVETTVNPSLSTEPTIQQINLDEKPILDKSLQSDDNILNLEKSEKKEEEEIIEDTQKPLQQSPIVDEQTEEADKEADKEGDEEADKEANKEGDEEEDEEEIIDNTQEPLQQSPIVSDPNEEDEEEDIIDDTGTTSTITNSW